MDIANRLRQERKRLHLSQEQFSSLGGVKKRTQINYEQGMRTPSAAYLASVAASGVDVQYVLTGVSANRGLDHTEKLLLRSFRRASRLRKKTLFARLSPAVKVSTAKAHLHG